MQFNSAKISVLALCLFTLIALGWKAGESASVQVQTTQLRSKPSFFSGKKLAPLSYGDAVTVRNEKDAWVQVDTGGGTCGWISASALTHKKVILDAGNAPVNVKANQEELALAGRGFSKEIEAEYRQGKRKLDYATVDTMETDALFQISDTDLTEFLRNGNVTPNEGGAE